MSLISAIPYLALAFLLYLIPLRTSAVVESTPQEYTSLEDVESNELKEFFKDKVVSINSVKNKNEYEESNIKFDRSPQPKVDILKINTDMSQDTVRYQHIPTTEKAPGNIDKKSNIPKSEETFLEGYIESSEEYTDEYGC